MAKNPFANYLFNLTDECVAHARNLKEILNKERAALITLNTDDILILVSQKDSGMLKLQRKKAELKKFMREHFQSDSMASLSFSDPFLEAEWNTKKESWELSWNELRGLCEHNQRFINHSMKNLDRLVENLKRLLGQHATYSPKGKRVDQNSQGSVVEGRY